METDKRKIFLQKLKRLQEKIAETTNLSNKIAADISKAQKDFETYRQEKV